MLKVVPWVSFVQTAAEEPLLPIKALTVLDVGWNLKNDKLYHKTGDTEAIFSKDYFHNLFLADFYI